MMGLAWTGVRMIALSVVLAMAADVAGFPGWVHAASSLLLLGGAVNLVVAGAFEFRRGGRGQGGAGEGAPAVLPGPARGRDRL